MNTTKIIPYLTLFLTITSFSQEIKKDTKVVETKMEIFTSKTGIISKFIDTKLPSLKLTYGEMSDTRIRKLIIDSESRFFYQIIKSGKYSNTTASIEYSDLLEVIKAMKTLKVEIEKDIASNPDYLENKFTTVDGFQVGYYIDSGKTNWYLKLEKYGSDSTLFIKDGDILESAFVEAKNKIEELKK
jgi:hypothetical protein